MDKLRKSSAGTTAEESLLHAPQARVDVQGKEVGSNHEIVEFARQDIARLAQSHADQKVQTKQCVDKSGGQDGPDVEPPTLK